jgi:hypothetical protein
VVADVDHFLQPHQTAGNPGLTPAYRRYHLHPPAYLLEIATAEGGNYRCVRRIDYGAEGPVDVRRQTEWAAIEDGLQGADVVEANGHHG